MERDVATLCAYLLRRGYLKKSDFPEIELHEHLFEAMQQSLTQVGMELVWNSYSPYYAVRLKKEVQDTLEESNTLGLKSNEVAMLVILWSKLVLPKRLVSSASASAGSPSSSSLPAPAALVPGSDNGKRPTLAGGPGIVTVGQRDPARESLFPDLYQEPEDKASPTQETSLPKDKIFLRLNDLYAEFGKHFGHKSTFKALLTRLNNLQFIRLYNEIITEGIFLDLLIDGYEMGNELKKSALAYKLAGIPDEEEGFEEEEPAEEIDSLAEQPEESSEDNAAEEN